MIRIIDLDHAAVWDRLVRTLPSHDVYYLSGYVRGFQIHGDGEPILIWWENEGVKAACVLMIRDISDDERFSTLKKKEYFDAVTPYGYGGFIFSQEPNEQQSLALNQEFVEALQQRNIISVFFRFHPILKNAKLSTNICDVIDLGKTISLDLKDEETIWANITSKNRNLIRKAERLGVKVHHGKGLELLYKFRKIYEETMHDDNADEYYYFNEDFYKSIASDLADNYEIFYTVYQDAIISIAIFLFEKDQIHYHLSGSLRKYRSFSANNLLLYKVALWGLEKGYKTLHLGGGVGSGDDSLYRFKAAFNRNSDNQFSIGKIVVNKALYDRMVRIREDSGNLILQSNFFPIYRS